MATLQIFKCISCGYEVRTEPTGRYALMSGVYINCRCDVCDNIVSVSGADYTPKCSVCGATSDHLLNWNPLDGCCPKCGASMRLDEEAPVILAD